MARKIAMALSVLLLGACFTGAAEAQDIKLYAFSSGALTLGGFEVAKVLAMRMADIQTPQLLATMISGMVVALFAGIGGIFAHLALKSDPVEARCEELIPQLQGEFQDLQFYNRKRDRSRLAR